MTGFSDYYNDLLELVAYYREKKEVVRELIKGSPVPLSILHDVYERLVKAKEIAPIESLPIEKKNTLWRESICQPKRRMQYCKAAYLLEIL